MENKEAAQAGIGEKSSIKVMDITNAVSVQSDGHTVQEVSGTGGVTIEYDQVKDIPQELVGPIRWDHPNQANPKILDAKAGIVERKRNKVCIVGYAEVSRHMAWYDDPDCEIWGVNQLNRFIPRADRWFQIHTNWMDKTRWAKGTDQLKFLQDCPIPVYMADVNPAIPNSVRFPKERVMEDLKVHNYFTSSIAFMVSLAIAEGFKEIGIYGIDLIIGREYHFEKACVEFYLGIAHARGIEYHLPEGCALLWQSHCYGYELEPDYGFFGLEKLKTRGEHLRNQVMEMKDDVKFWGGKIEEATYIRERFTSEEPKKQMDKHIYELRVELDSRLNKLFLHDGALQEISRMHDILEVRSRGGQVS